MAVSFFAGFPFIKNILYRSTDKKRNWYWLINRWNSPGIGNAEFAIRESLISLAKNGTSIIVLAQDLDELFEITHRVSVIFNGTLSDSFETKNISIEKIGLLMGGHKNV